MSSSSGTPEWDASSTAGCRLATAVPDVVTTGTGRPLPLARPSARKRRGALVDAHVQAQALVTVGGVQRVGERS